MLSFTVDRQERTSLPASDPSGLETHLQTSRSHLGPPKVVNYQTFRVVMGSHCDPKSTSYYVACWSSILTFLLYFQTMKSGQKHVTRGQNKLL